MRAPRWLAAAPLAFVAMAGAALAVEPAASRSTALEPPPSQPWWDIDLLAPLRPFGVEGWGDVLVFEPWGGSIGLRFDEQQQRLKAPDGSTQRYSNRIGGEALTIRNDAISLADRRLFMATVEAGITFEQQRQNAAGQELSQTGHLANYVFDGNFLVESPYHLNLFATQTQNTFVLPSGATTDSDFRNRGVAFHLRQTSFLRDWEWLPYFTANVRAQQQLDKQTTVQGTQTFRLDDRRDQFAFDFQNGGLTSDLAFQYEYTRLRNFAYEQGSYDSHSANMVYSVDFGPTLNWRWDSRVNWYSRSGRDGGSDQSSWDVTEFLTIDHDASFSTTYTYQFNRQDSSAGIATVNGAGFQAFKQVYANLSVAGGANALLTDVPGGKIDTLGASGSINYSHRLPWEGTLTAYGGGGYTVTESKVAAGVVPVVDAPYTVPPNVGAGSSILLKDLNIVANTIVVIVLRGGARVPAYVDVDYTVRVDGDRTSLVPLSTSAVMQPGDTLNASYTYVVSPDSKFSTATRSATLAVDWLSFGASVSHDESDQKERSGGPNAILVDQRRTAGQAYVHGGWEDLDGRITAGQTLYDSDRLAYRERRFDENVIWKATPYLQLNLAANQYRTEYEIPVHTTSGKGFRLDMSWNWYAWLVTGFAGTRWYSDTRQPPEKVEEIGFRLRRNWTKLDLNMAFGAQQRYRGDASQLNGYFHIGVVRRF